MRNFLLALIVATAGFVHADDRLAALDAYWAEVSRSVREGDSAGYAATCHPEGVLISEKSQLSKSLAAALKGWQAGFDATAAGDMTASVEFRFSQRWGDDETAYEKGIFRYVSQKKGEPEAVSLVYLEAVLTRTEKGWLVLMEKQGATATEEEWEALG